MHRHQQHMLLCAQPQQLHPQQRSLPKIKRLAAPPPSPAALPPAPARFRQLAQLRHRRSQRLCRPDHLHRALPPPPRTSSATLHAAARFRSTLRSSASTSNSPTQPQRHRHVVDRTPRLQLIQKPQSLLRKRNRQRLASRSPSPAAALSALAPRHCAASIRSANCRDGRRFKQRPQRQLHLENLPHSRHHLRRQQRVPAQLEEVVGYSHSLYSATTRSRSPPISLPPHSAAPHSSGSCRSLSPAPATPADQPSRSASAAAPPATHIRSAPCTPAVAPAAQLATRSPIRTPHSDTCSNGSVLRYLSRSTSPATKYATNRWSPVSPSSRTTTTASFTPACSLSPASTSPNSIRYPRTFTCWSTRPKYSNSPSAR